MRCLYCQTRPLLQFQRHAMKNFSLFLVCLFGWGLWSAGAEPILNLVFDDPQGLIKSKPEGILEIPKELSSKDGTISSGSGGKAVLLKRDGTTKGGKTPGGKFLVLTEPTMSTPAFLRMVLEDGTKDHNIGTIIIPSSVETSLSSFVSYDNGMTVLNGAFDFFVRFTVTGDNPPTFAAWGKCASLGFKFALDNRDMTLSVFTPQKSLNVDGQKVGTSGGLSGASKTNISIESGEIYHIAVAFRTTEDHSISLNIYAQPGTGPINLSDGPVASIQNFWMVEDRSRLAADKISIYMRSGKTEQLFDMAAFRIFHPLPEVLPGIDGK